MKERGILFSAPMVRAILAGKKTVTRRLASWPMLGPSDGVKRRVYGSADLERERAAILACCPQGRPGHRLWVRETWQYAGFTEDGYPFIHYRADDTKRLCERVDPAWSDRLTGIWAKLSEPANFHIDERAADRVWRPAIFLPRWASRLILEVTNVRLERLQDIGDNDARAEGVEASMFPDTWLCVRKDGSTGDMFVEPDEETRVRMQIELVKHRPAAQLSSAREVFSRLWDSINGERAAWLSNPWVWAVSFRVVERKPNHLDPHVTASGGNAATPEDRKPQPPAQQPESRLPPDDSA